MANEFSWWAIVPTVIGASISVLTTVVMFSLNQRTERNKRKEESKSKNAFSAYVGLQKILKTAQAIISLERHIDQEFAEAHETGHSVEDPGNVVRPILYSPSLIDDLSAEEYYFLAKAGKADLILEILELQQRARNNDAIVRDFNLAKADYDQYLETRTHAVRSMQVDRASYDLVGDDAIPAIMKMGRLNTLIGALLPALEEDIPRVKRVVDEFLKAAVAEFGDDFPKTKIEWVEKNANP